MESSVDDAAKIKDVKALETKMDAIIKEKTSVKECLEDLIKAVQTTQGPDKKKALKRKTKNKKKSSSETSSSGMERACRRLRRAAARDEFPTAEGSPSTD